MVQYETTICNINQWKIDETIQILITIVSQHNKNKIEEKSIRIE